MIRRIGASGLSGIARTPPWSRGSISRGSTEIPSPAATIASVMSQSFTRKPILGSNPAEAQPLPISFIVGLAGPKSGSTQSSSARSAYATAFESATG
jgi:hypothetical protein